jgi:acylphosphatase
MRRPRVADEPLKRVRVTADGRVQGVFFRAETARAARSLGLSGWVRNTADGSVEAAFEGTPDAVTTVVEWCRHGPRFARVDSLDVREEEITGEKGFEVRY